MRAARAIRPRPPSSAVMGQSSRSMASGSSVSSRALSMSSAWAVGEPGRGPAAKTRAGAGPGQQADQGLAGEGVAQGHAGAGEAPAGVTDKLAGEGLGVPHGRGSVLTEDVFQDAGLHRLILGGVENPVTRSTGDYFCRVSLKSASWTTLPVASVATRVASR